MSDKDADQGASPQKQEKKEKGSKQEPKKPEKGGL